jgi:hypothetical protein
MLRLESPEAGLIGMSCPRHNDIQLKFSFLREAKD